MPRYCLLPVLATDIEAQSCAPRCLNTFFPGWCSNASMACSEDNFWFINSCSVLRRHFRCERGCAVELGLDIPNYVMDPSLRTYQTCLVSQSQPSCTATHMATARLCPCI